MGANSKIEWTDHTFNPWTGCAKVSPGCENCYAEGWSKRSGIVQWGPGKPRRRTSAANWREPVKWNAAAGCCTDPALASRRPRVFCASLADWLDDDGVPIEWLADLLHLIRTTPQLDWLLLTKRPQNWRARLALANGYLASIGDLEHFETCPKMQTAFWIAAWIEGKPPANVWIGTTVEDQKRADERIPRLIQIPAVVRFLSCEPLLGPVDLFSPSVDWFPPGWGKLGRSPKNPAIGWVIIGGESGQRARPMHPDWSRKIRDQCAAVEIPMLFKQWGEWLPAADIDVCDPRLGMTTSDARYHALPSGGGMIRVGKHAAGRLLDGVEHNAFPKGGAS